MSALDSYRQSLDAGVKVLSVRTPWAWLIVNGFKDVENRSWTTSYRGSLLIHAGYHLESRGYEVAEKFGIRIPGDLPRGGLIGLVDLVDITRSSDSPWYQPDHYAWLIVNPQPMPFVPCRGLPGLFVPALE